MVDVGMKYTHKELVKEFYDGYIKERYNGISQDRLNDIVSAPWLYLKEIMASGELISVRLKYFGTFVVYPKRVLGMFDKIRKRFKDQRETPEKYAKKVGIMKRYLERHESDT